MIFFSTGFAVRIPWRASSLAFVLTVAALATNTHAAVATEPEAEGSADATYTLAGLENWSKVE